MSGKDQTFVEFAVEVRGAEGVVQQFLTAGNAVRARVAETLRELGNELASKAQARAPQLSGQLAHSISADEVRTTSDLARMTVTVRPRGYRAGVKGKNKYKYGNYAIGLFAERGLQPKPYFRRREGFGMAAPLTMKGGRLVRETMINKKGKEVNRRPQKVWYGRTIRRRPVAAQPFMTPAFLSMKDGVAARIDAAISAALLRSVA